MIGQTVSHYKILEKLGEGGMGVVYRAHDLTLDRDVALKFLPGHLQADESARKRFIHEAKAASALEHPNICAVYEIDTAADGRIFIVMPCYEGRTLRERLEQGPLPVEEALDIGVQIAGGLSRAHEKGIVHRDIKPGNIQITPDGVVKVMDFGLAKLSGATKVTKTGMTVGTVAYMSPEQTVGKDVDQRTDIWSLGVILYEMLTGRVPFPGDAEPAVLYSILNVEPDPVTKIRRDIPFEIETIVERALEKDAVKRYQTMGELTADIARERERLALGLKGRRLPKVRASTRRRVLRVGVPLAVTAAVVAVILKTLEIDIRPKSPQVYAEENSMAVMYFENLEDPEDNERTAEVITNLVTTGLAESDYIRVVSQQRIYDILERMGEADIRVMDGRLVSEVAGRTGVNWIITGSVIQTDPNIVVRAEISNRLTGEIRGSHQIRQEPAENVFSVANKLIHAIGRDMALPSRALNEVDRSVEHVTTSSVDAYRHYVEGLRMLRKWSWEEAFDGFERAVEIDSTFALAYAQMAYPAIAVKGEKAAKRYADKAIELADKLPITERLRIEAVVADFEERTEDKKRLYEQILVREPDDIDTRMRLSGLLHYELDDNEGAIRCLEKVTALDSLNAYAHSMLAWCYMAAGKREAAFLTAKKGVEVAKPDEAPPYQALGELYAITGDIDAALACLLKGQRIRRIPQVTHLIGSLYLFEGAYAQAESTFKDMVVNGKPYQRVFGRRCLAYIPMYQGRLDDALALLDNGIAADLMERDHEEYDKQVFKAMIFMEKKQYDLALAALDRVIELKRGGDQRPWQIEWMKVLCLTQAGHISEAESLVTAMGLDINTGTSDMLRKRREQTGNYRCAMGCVELARGDTGAAIEHFDYAAKATWELDFASRYLLAQAYSTAGRTEDAIREYTALLSKYYFDSAYRCLWMARSNYELARMHEQVGRNEDAAFYYRQFLDLWKDADPGLEVVDDARRRLSALEAGVHEREL